MLLAKIYRFQSSEIFKIKRDGGWGEGGPIFSIKREGLLKIGGGYFLKKGVSLIFIITSPFQC